MKTIFTKCIYKQRHRWVDFDYISNVLAGKHLRSCPQRRSSKSWVSNYQWKRRMQEKRWSQKQDGG